MENPAETYLGTIWELLPDNKFLKTGTTPLQQGGSNSISILKENLPTEKLQVESHSLTRGTMDITGTLIPGVYSGWGDLGTGAFYKSASGQKAADGESDGAKYTFQASRSWIGNTSSASPYTSVMGNGTPITINPEYITLRAWKRTK